jgi:hypothetical protein
VEQPCRVPAAARVTDKMLPHKLLRPRYSQHVLAAPFVQRQVRRTHSFSEDALMDPVTTHSFSEDALMDPVTDDLGLK